MEYEDVIAIMRESLYEFPVSEVNVNLPGWVQELDSHHWLRSHLESDIFQIIDSINRVSDLDNGIAALAALTDTENAKLALSLIHI